MFGGRPLPVTEELTISARLLEGEACSLGGVWLAVYH